MDHFVFQGDRACQQGAGDTLADKKLVRGMVFVGVPTDPIKRG